jgi:uncharacterized membrane protein YqaE (UPF0057 family)
MQDNILYLKGNNISVNEEIYNLENFYNSLNKTNTNTNTKTNNYIIITFTNLLEYLKTIKKNFTIYDDYFILFNGKIISNDIKLKYIYEKENIENVKKFENIVNFNIIQKQKGGSIIDAFMAIIDIGKFFFKIGDVILWLIKFVLWFVDFMYWMLFDLFNPRNFFNDFFKSVQMIIYTLANLAFNLVISFAKISANTIAGWMQGFWGWDMSNLSKKDKNSPYFQRFDKTKGQKVYYTNSNTVPFSIILGTILCPPMGVFMDLGLTGWLNIIICALLTLLFYLPGLCYALLIIYS